MEILPFYRWLSYLNLLYRVFPINTFDYQRVYMFFSFFFLVGGLVWWSILVPDGHRSLGSPLWPWMLCVLIYMTISPNIYGPACRPLHNSPKLGHLVQFISDALGTKGLTTPYQGICSIQALLHFHATQPRPAHDTEAVDLPEIPLETWG